MIDSKKRKIAKVKKKKITKIVNIGSCVTSRRKGQNRDLNKKRERAVKGKSLSLEKNII